MVKEITISKAMFDSLVGSIQNLAGIFERDLPNERNIIRSKLYEMKEIGRELVDIAKIRHPDQFGGPALTLEMISAEKETLLTELQALGLIITPQEALVASKQIVKIRSRLVKLDKIRDRLIEKLDVGNDS